MIRYSEKFQNFGLFFLRITMGMLLIYFSVPRLLEGSSTWALTGSIMKNIGITFLPQIWGLIILVIQFFCGIFLILGLFSRISSLFLLLICLVIITGYIKNRNNILSDIRTILYTIIFFSLIFTGPGRFSLDRALFFNK